MKTIVILSDFTDLPKFYVVDRNVTHLEGTIINVNDTEASTKELVDITEKLTPYGSMSAAIAAAGPRPLFANCGFAP